MEELLYVALAGFSASLVDGALGMGFGPTSSSILLGTGLSPASVSTTVNLAKVASGIASGISHWRFRNIDHRLVLQLAIPGCVGALLGVTVLSQVDAATLRPALAGLLSLIGLRILWRFRRPVATDPEEFEDLEHDPDRMPPFNDRGLKVVAATGGVTNGLIGTWGPIVTPFLMHRSLPPRFAVGSVNTAEVAVAAVSATSLITAMGRGDLNAPVIAVMLAGGVAGAPVAAWLVRRVPARPMGVAVGALLLWTNARELSDWQRLGDERWLAYAAIGVAVALTALRPRLRRRQPVPERTEAPPAPPPARPRPASDHP
jgi:uncharacterized membrane protein YfcA